MAESEIPADIQKAAAKLLLDTRFAHDEAHHLRLLSQALLAERERCRLIAAGFDDGSDSGFSQAARTIERIIRQDNPNET